MEIHLEDMPFLFPLTQNLAFWNANDPFLSWSIFRVIRTPGFVGLISNLAKQFHVIFAFESTYYWLCFCTSQLFSCSGAHIWVLFCSCLIFPLLYWCIIYYWLVYYALHEGALEAHFNHILSNFVLGYVLFPFHGSSILFISSNYNVY